MRARRRKILPLRRTPPPYGDGQRAAHAQAHKQKPPPDRVHKGLDRGHSGLIGYICGVLPAGNTSTAAAHTWRVEQVDGQDLDDLRSQIPLRST